MNVYSITFQTIANALRRQSKLILASLLVFALLGAAGGFLFRDRGMAAAGGGAQALPAVDFGALPYTKDYYAACLNALSNGLDGLNRYMSALSINTGPDEERQAALDALSADAAEFQSVILRPLQSALNEPGAVIVPAEFLDGMAEQCTQELETVRMDLIAAEVATETVRQMDAPNFDGGGSSGNYGNLLSLASQYPTMLRNQAITEKYLDRLENHMPEIRAESRRVERELNAAMETLAALADRLLVLADETAKEQGLIFTPKVENGKVTDVIVTHAHRASSAQESFAVIVLFCVLAGLCLGMFLAVCREAKEEAARRAQSEAPPPSQGK